MNSSKEFWLKQIALGMGCSLTVFFLSVRIALGPLTRHYEDITSFYGQSMVSALLAACAIGMSLAAVMLALVVVRAVSLSKQLSEQTQAQIIAQILAKA